MRKPKIDLNGWGWTIVIMGALWFIMMFNACKNYFIYEGIELAKLVGALGSSVIIVLLQVMRQWVGWVDYGKEIQEETMQFCIDHAEQLIKATPAGKLMETYNFMGDEGGGGEEVIGG